MGGQFSASSFQLSLLGLQFCSLPVFGFQISNFSFQFGVSSLQCLQAVKMHKLACTNWGAFWRHTDRQTDRNRAKLGQGTVFVVSSLRANSI